MLLKSTARMLTQLTIMNTAIPLPFAMSFHRKLAASWPDPTAIGQEISQAPVIIGHKICFPCENDVSRLANLLSSMDIRRPGTIPPESCSHVPASVSLLMKKPTCA